MSLPAISTAAYVYSTNQSAVQVTYVDATTAIVYPNQFENPRTQQLNDWVRGGGQIAPYVKPPIPIPGPPQYISLYMPTNDPLSNGQVLTGWVANDSFGLTTDGTYVSLKANKTYEITFNIVLNQIAGGDGSYTFSPVSSTGATVPITGNPFFSAVIWTPAFTPSTTTNGSTGNTFIYTPTTDIQIGIQCTTSPTTLTAQTRTYFTSFIINEVLDEALVAMKIGPQGPAGPEGPVGPTGPAGPLGPAGPVGSTGATGDTGPVGPSGPLGATGPAGVAGPEGPEGPAGPQGQPGPGFSFQGTVATPQDLPDPADEGDAYTVTSTNTLWIYSGTQWNDAGVIQGPQGVQGTQGGVGATGPAGAQGPAGPAGPAGATGATGPAGATGPQGPAGPAGPTGATGSQGPVGPAGPAGPTGATGAPGATGSVGPQGPQGPQGLTGPAGPPGAIASVVSSTIDAPLNTGQQSTPANIGAAIALSNVSGFTVLAQVGVGGTPASIHGLMTPLLKITNSTTGYSQMISGNNAMVNTGQNYLIDMMMGGVNFGASGLVAQGDLVFQFQYTGQFFNTDTVNANLQYTILYW